MNFSKTGKILMVLAIVAVLGIAVTSFAGWGRGHWGYGHHMGPGYGMHRGWGDGPSGYGSSGYQSGLSDEDIARLDKERRVFFEATNDLREELYQKELELRSELAKPEPDTKKAAGLQREISDLEGQLDQKRLDQQIKMRKDFPRFENRAYGGMGMGRGMYGRGGGGYGRGDGACWN
jgi:hypothetical protein